MLSIFDIVAGLLTLTAFFSWANHRFLRLPNNVGLLLMGMAASLVLVGLEVFVPNIALFGDLEDFIKNINFSEALLDGMLAFLLFAGALQIDLSLLRDRAWAVATMATVGVVISTIVVAILFWGAGQLFGLPIGFAWALVFGALISPTDPIAVLAVLKQARVAKTLEMDMAGESLFNDGVGVVLFTILLAAAMSSTGDSGIDFAHIARLFFVEALGGALLGAVTGYLAYLAMRGIDDYPIEVLISLGLVTGTYAIADLLHVSGPIAVVVSGRDYRQPRRQPCHERNDTALFVRFLEPDRRAPELHPVPADRAGGSGDQFQRLAHSAGHGGDPRRVHGATDLGSPTYSVYQNQTAFREGHHSHSHLGRRARRHLRGAGAVHSLCRRTATNSCCHLRGRALHPGRAGSYAARGGAALCQSGPGQDGLTTPARLFRAWAVRLERGRGC